MKIDARHVDGFELFDYIADRIDISAEDLEDARMDRDAGHPEIGIAFLFTGIRGPVPRSVVNFIAPNWDNIKRAGDWADDYLQAVSMNGIDESA